MSVMARQNRRSVKDLVAKFYLQGLLPKLVFFELSATTKRADARADLDRR
jgi:hypothetical protein